MSRTRACPPAATVSCIATRPKGSPRPTGARSTASRAASAPARTKRVRWRCPINAPSCKPQTTRPRDNARLYTFYPCAGDGPLAIKRQALLIRRNSVESVFSSLKCRGVGGKGHHRLKLIGDGPADWIISLAALHLTAARVAHDTGAYANTYAAAEHLGYLAEPTARDPAPYIDEARGIVTADPPRAITRARCVAPRRPRGRGSAPAAFTLGRLES